MKILGQFLAEINTLRAQSIEATVANLPFAIAKREVVHAGTMLGWSEECWHPRKVNETPGPGNIVAIHLDYEAVNEVFAAFGRQGVSAEAVAREAAREAQTYLAGNHPVGLHLADQLLLPLALGAGGRIMTGPLTDHTKTNIHVIRQFLDISISVENQPDGSVILDVVSRNKSGLLDG